MVALLVMIQFIVQIFPLVGGNCLLLVPPRRLQLGIFIYTLVKLYNKANILYYACQFTNKILFKF